MYDVIIIGAGPGGYIAALRARQLGLTVALVEREGLGGVCLNWGCIPSKHYIHKASEYEALTSMEALGVTIDRSTFDFSKVYASSRRVVATLTGGIAALMTKQGVEVISGTASFLDEQTILVDGDELRGGRIIIATGARPAELKGFEFDESVIFSSTGVLGLKELPKSLLVLGGGAIGCEMAQVFAIFGVEVTLIEAADRLLPTEDIDVSSAIQRQLARLGVNVLTDSKALSYVRSTEGLTTNIEKDGGTSSLTAEKILVAVGRVPNTDALNLDVIDVDVTEKGFLEVNEFGQTSNHNIYAIGDVTRTPMLAHVASLEAERAIDAISGIPPGPYPLMVPSAIYTEPQAAGFGLRESAVEAFPENASVTVFPLSGAGKSIAISASEGFVKIISDTDTQEILGAHIVAHNATEMIHELLLTAVAELLPEDVINTVHAHPTLSEANQEAMRSVLGRAYHS